jgi:hypothetical protein
MLPAKKTRVSNSARAGAFTSRIVRYGAFHGPDHDPRDPRLFDESDLFRASFGPGRYVGCDLRGNDLSTVNSVHHLKRAVIDRSQLLQLATALAINLDVIFGDELAVTPWF